MSLVLQVGTNSWATLTEANTYFEAKYGATLWTSLSDVQKLQLLVSAFNWIRQQSLLSVPTSATADTVKNAQCEAAWFVYRWSDEYERRRALSSSGVKSFSVAGWSESLGATAFPQFIADMLIDYAANIGGGFMRMSRDVEDNGSE